MCASLSYVLRPQSRETAGAEQSEEVGLNRSETNAKPVSDECYCILVRLRTDSESLTPCVISNVNDMGNDTVIHMGIAVCFLGHGHRGHSLTRMRL